MLDVGGPIDQRELPDDIAALKELLIAQASAHAAELAVKDEQLRHLQRDYDILKRIAFGPKSDRRHTKHVPDPVDAPTLRTT